MAQTEALTQQPPMSEHLEVIVSGRLRQALLLTVWSHSLALFSDAGHGPYEFNNKDRNGSLGR